MKLFKQVMAGLIILTLAISLVGCMAKSEYETLQEKYTDLQANYEVSQEENSNLQEENTNLQTNLDDLQATASELAQTESELAELEYEFNLLQNDYDELGNRYSELETEYASTLAEYISTLDEYISALEELGQSLQVPYTAISGREITWAWKDMDGDIHKWTLPIDSYLSWIEKSKPHKILLLSSDGKTYRIEDFRPYVHTEAFSEVISSFYLECADEMAFAKEVFNLVSQLTVYSEDIGEVPRWPVETLTEAGGDCEDLAILFASLLKAAPYPYKISLVYLDIDNPTDPQDVNHVIVWVETDDWKAFVECTSNQGWDYYERVVGWYYEL